MGELQPNVYQPNERSLYRDRKWTEDISSHPIEQIEMMGRDYYELVHYGEELTVPRQRKEAEQILGRIVFEISYRMGQMKSFEEQLSVDYPLSVDQLPQAA